MKRAKERHKLRGQEEAILEKGGEGGTKTTETEEPIGKEETFITTLTGLCVYSATVALTYSRFFSFCPLEETHNIQRQTVGILQHDWE